MNAEPTKKTVAARRPAYLVIAILLFSLALLAGFGLKPVQAEYFPVRFVRIQGAFNYLDKREIEVRILPLLERGYLEMDLDRIRSRIESVAWVSAVQIQRIWPDTLVLKVEEHAPFARFGEDRLLSSRGVVFAPHNTKPFATLPQIEAPTGQSAKSADFLTAFQKLQAVAGGLGMHVLKVRISERNSWSIQIADGLTVELGRDEPVKTFQRFIATLSLLGEPPIRSMIRADLRYRNGYAVQWKPGAEPEWSAFVKRNDPRSGEAPRSI
jgi:cell division protein FtsQ